jgi:putative tryptophan/tyrosine transport system substrate-binding protein
MSPDLDGKRLELLKEAFPKVARVAFLWPSGGTRGNLTLTDMEAAAKALGLKLLSLPVRGLDDFESAFARAKRDGAQAHYDRKFTYHYSATPTVGLRGKEPVAGDIPNE